MWIAYKVPSDMSLEDIAKKTRNTGLKAILTHPKNKAIAALYRQGQRIPKGTVVWVLDAKAKVYKVVVNGKTVYLTEAEYKKQISEHNKVMDFAEKQYRLTYNTVVWRQNDRRKLNAKHWAVSSLTASWWGETGREPVKQQKAALAAYKQLATVVKSRDYARFAKAQQGAANAINAYAKGMDEWEAQHNGSAGNWITGVTVVRDASFITFGALAMTVAAPATVLGTVAAGAGVGGGTAVLKSGANEAGRVVAGQKVEFKDSAKKVMIDGFKGAIIGATSAGIAKWIGGFVAPKIAARLTTSKPATEFAARFVGKSPIFKRLSARIIGKETEALVKKLGMEAVSDIPQTALDRIGNQVIGKLLTRISVGSVVTVVDKYLLTPAAAKAMKAYMIANASSLINANSSQIGDSVAKGLDVHWIQTAIYEELLDGNKALLEKELSVAIRADLQARGKAKAKQLEGAK